MFQHTVARLFEFLSAFPHSPSVAPSALAAAPLFSFGISRFPARARGTPACLPWIGPITQRGARPRKNVVGARKGRASLGALPVSESALISCEGTCLVLLAAGSHTLAVAFSSASLGRARRACRQRSRRKSGGPPLLLADPTASSLDGRGKEANPVDECAWLLLSAVPNLTGTWPSG